MTEPLHKITLYRDDSTTPVVFENVKHTFWTADNSVFVIAQMSDLATGKHHYIHWPRERFCWFRHERQDGKEVDYRTIVDNRPATFGGTS